MPNAADILTPPTPKIVVPASILDRSMLPKDLGFIAADFPQFRDEQLEILERTLITQKKHVVIQAPPGVGKTLVGAALARIYSRQIIYTCSTKTLQDQVVADFHTVEDKPFARSLKGKNAYRTLVYPDMWPFVSAELCLKKKTPHCSFCCDMDDILNYGTDTDCTAFKECPYQVARRKAFGVHFPVLNMAMFLSMSAYKRTENDIAQNASVIFDEADLLEHALLSFVQVKISDKWIKKLGIAEPEKKTVEESWTEWMGTVALPAASERLKVLKDSTNTENVREEFGLTSFIQRGWHFLSDIKSNPWVWEPETKTFKPVTIERFGKEYFWDKVKRSYLFSATVISVDQLCNDLGIDRREVEFIDIASPFPATRRPVYYEPVGAITRANMDTIAPRLMFQVDKILDRHQKQNVLVHTVSYQLADYIVRGSRHTARMVQYRDAASREGALEHFKKAKEPKILVAPSMERGVDLPDDKCRAIIILKVPWPNKGDRQVQKRLYAMGRSAGNLWYSISTIRTLIQMTGRGVRHDKDYCFTYILDATFGDLYRQRHNMFPSWWRAALKMPSTRRKGV